MARLFHNALVLATLATFLSFATAQRALYSIANSTSTCISNSSITADIFSASITPDNNTIGYDIFGTFNYSGPVLLSYILTVNSETTLNITEDPCSGTGTAYLCPASPGQIGLNSNINTPAGDLDTISEDVYTTSNPDANFRYVMTNAESGEIVGCLQTNLTNDASREANSTETGGSGANSTGNANETGSANETGGGAQNDESGASTSYLNWTLFCSAIIALACGGVL